MEKNKKNGVALVAFNWPTTQQNIVHVTWIREGARGVYEFHLTGTQQ
jgi:hypothetical protein